MNRSLTQNLPLLALALLMSLGSSGCLFFGGKKAAPLAGAKAAPDKVLFTRATDDIKHGRYTVARLTLQTLINTYPDSEYLAKAKLAIADSFYKEGGTQGLTQAVSEYKDFITFFPFLDEAAYAQYRVAMAHFRMMEKPDRDRTQALLAEAELQTMILKYPKSQWTKEATQRLRDVQEVLADSEFRVAHFYDLRGAYGAAAARLLELTERYPLFSQADQANFMLAQIYEKTEHNDFAARFYSNIVREYPLSEMVPDARKRLIALGYPVPQPDPKALARMQDEQKYIRERPGLVRQALGILKSGPDVSHASHYGEPNLTQDTDVISARQVLEPAVVSLAATSASGEDGNSISVAGVSGGGSAPVGQTPPGVTASSVPAATPQHLANQAKSMEDPSKGPKANAKIDLNKKPQDKKANDKDKKKKDDSAKKKKKKGIHKLIPW
jgi:outer membrane protein assembly factor BamD